MISLINKGSYDKLILKGNFSDNELIEMSIYQVDKNKKTLQNKTTKNRLSVLHVNPSKVKMWIWAFLPRNL